MREIKLKERPCAALFTFTIFIKNYYVHTTAIYQLPQRSCLLY